MRWIGSEGRPGLPQPSFGHGGQRRTARLQLFFVDNRDSGNMSELQHVVGLLRAPGQPCSRFSVALPLGINGQELAWWVRGWSYPPFLNGPKPAGPTATSVAGLRGRRLRPARPKGSQKVQPHSAKFILSALLALSFSGSPPAESSNELRRVAALRLPGRRTVRLCEPQKLGPFTPQFCWFRAEHYGGGPNGPAHRPGDP